MASLAVASVGPGMTDVVIDTAPPGTRAPMESPTGSVVAAGGVGAAAGGSLAWIGALNLKTLLQDNPLIAVACLLIMGTFSMFVLYLNIKDERRGRTVQLFGFGAFGLAILCIVLSMFNPGRVKVMIAVTPDFADERFPALTIDNPDRSITDPKLRTIVLERGGELKEIPVRKGDVLTIAATKITGELRTLRSAKSTATETQRAEALAESPTE